MRVFAFSDLHVDYAVNLNHIKRHYYASHTTINPTGIVPRGPELDFTAPHGRERLRAA